MSAEPGLRCAWCHDGAGPAPLRCPACGTLLHPECARELAGSCSTLGCAGREQGSWRVQCPCSDRPLSWTGRALLGLLDWAAR